MYIDKSKCYFHLYMFRHFDMVDSDTHHDLCGEDKNIIRLGHRNRTSLLGKSKFEFFIVQNLLENIV